MTVYSGAKIALLTDNDQILTYLRDNKPGLYMANLWDLPGGGTEDNELPLQTIIREVKEEFGFELSPDQIIYEAEYPSDRFPDTMSKFYVGRITAEQQANISFGSEGQRYKFINITEFLNLSDAIPHFQERLKIYLGN